MPDQNTSGLRRRQGGKAKEETQPTVTDSPKAQPTPKPRWRPGLTHCVLFAGAFLLWRVGTSLRSIIRPMDKLEPHVFEPSLTPVWGDGDAANISVFVGTGRFDKQNACSESTRQVLLWRLQMPLSLTSETQSKDFWIDTRAGVQEERPAAAEGERVQIGESLRSMVRQVGGKDLNLAVCVSWRAEVVRSEFPLAMVGERPRKLDKRWLLQDIGLGWLSGVEPWRSADWQPLYPGHEEVPLWRSALSAHVVVERTEFPTKVWLPNVHPFLQMRWVTPQGKIHPWSQQTRPPVGASLHYMPPVYLTAMGLANEDHHVLHQGVEWLPLKVTVEATQLARWLLLNHYESALPNTMRQLGMSESDLSEVRQMIVGTNVWVFLATIMLSILHIVFETLALRSDVHFWKDLRSLRGIAISTLFYDLVAQMVIFLHLYDENATIIILGPMFAFMGIQVWKCWLATGFSLRREGWRLRFHCQRLEEERREGGEGVEKSLD
eukprot:Hpha_TRINITY_DN3591_c0_g2::TRINITY_DN3591_c0_g2_i1::g.25678::m.25678